jgi:hypothetical protein
MWKRFLSTVSAALFGTQLALGQVVVTAPPTVTITDPVVTNGGTVVSEYFTEPVDFYTRSNFWLSADFVLAKINGPNNPNTFLTTAFPATPREQAGILGAPTTSVLYGASPTNANGFNENVRPGFRIGAGAFLTPESRLGAEAGFMMLSSQASGLQAFSDGNTILARPFTNANTGAAEAALIGFPGVSSGDVEFRAASGNFYTFHAGVFESFFEDHWLRLESILGYRFYYYDEAFRAQQTVNSLDPNFIPGTQIFTRDDVSASNEFHGAEIGVRAHVWLADSLTLGLLAKVAGGNLRRQVDIGGAQTVRVPGQAPTFEPAGFLALASNSGRHVSNEFMAMPEFGATLTFQATPNLRLRVGYNGLLLCRAASAATQIDTVIDPALLPPATRPAVGGDRPRFQMQRENIWVQSVQLGAELNW